MRKVLLIAALAGGLAYGCVTPIPEVAVGGGKRPADFPEQVYRQAAAEGRPVFRIDPASSIVVIEVRRAGSLARLGHDHVVASHDLQGYVLPDAGRADLYVALDELVVDEPDLRRKAGFDTEPSVEAIAGTRRNMLERTLETQHYPFASIGVRGIEARRGGYDATADVAITLHGTTRTVQAPVHINAGGDMLVTGRVTLAQTDFGIVPLSIVGGAIQVQDQVIVRFDVSAQRME